MFFISIGTPQVCAAQVFYVGQTGIVGGYIAEQLLG